MVLRAPLSACAAEMSKQKQKILSLLTIKTINGEQHFYIMLMALKKKEKKKKHHAGLGPPPCLALVSTVFLQSVLNMETNLLFRSFIVLLRSFLSRYANELDSHAC